MSEYTDTILLECNRKQSPEYLSKIEAGNPAHWTNNVGDGIKLDIGDQISVHSAYMSAIGNESATIEIKGQDARDNLGRGQLFNMSDTTRTKTTNACLLGDMVFEYTPIEVTKQITDNEIHLTHSYYKTTNGEFYYTLPRRSAWDLDVVYRTTEIIWNSYQGTANGLVGISPYYYATDYALENTYRGKNSGEIPNASIYTQVQTITNGINNDGSRYTLFVKDYNGNSYTNSSLVGHRDPALFNYNWYKRTYTYQIQEGFNSPANVAQAFTDQFNNVREIDTFQQTIGDGTDRENRNFDITAKSRTNEPFPCSHGFGFNEQVSQIYLQGGLNPNIELITGGQAVEITSITTPSTAPNTNWIGVSAADYAKAKPGMYIVRDDSGLTPSIVGHMVIDKQVSPAPHSTHYVYFDRTISQSKGGVAGRKYILNYRDVHRTYEYSYQSCYATIGYKRPEIQETGRHLDERGFGSSPQLTIDGSFKVRGTTNFPLSLNNDSIIDTTLEWNDENLLAIKRFVDSQELYPELFNTSEMSSGQKALILEPDTLTIDNTRFVHMNLSNVTEIATYPTLSTISGSFQVTVNSVTGLSPGDVLVDDQSGANFPVSFTSSNERTSKRTYIEYIDTAAKILTLSQAATASSGTGVSNTLTFTRSKLGSDNYGTTNASGESWSAALFFDYNKDRKDANDGFGQAPDRFNHLRYGWGVRSSSGTIGFYFGKYRNGIPQAWFPGVSIPGSVRNIGFDKHFNAYGTAALSLYNGLSGKYGAEYNNTSSGTRFHTYQDRKDLEGIPTANGTPANTVSSYTLMSFASNAQMNEIYIGANDPVLDFDADQSRFVFRRLHTPEIVGTDSAEVSASQSVADSEVICYKINKRLSRLNFSPNFTPYIHTKLGDSIILDKNIIPYSIMDARSGIFIESYGCDEKNWAQSLWTLLGFSYEQFHRTTDNRLVRYNNIALTCSTPTTNALIQTTDLQQYDKVKDLTAVHPESIPYPQYIDAEGSKRNVDISSTLLGYQDFPPIVQSCSSTGIVADNLPRKMISPIYLVKSDLLSPSYIGGPESTSKLPVIAVVPKNSGYGDFYNGGEDTIFTNTIPRTIQNIKTAISDADGTDARLDDGSCVIYKIVKTRQSNSQVLQDIMNPPKKK